MLLFMLFSSDAFAANEQDFASRITKEFETVTRSWESKLKPFAKDVLKWTLTAEILIIGIKAALGREDNGTLLKNFVMTIILGALFLAIIDYYGEWINNLIKGLKTIGLTIGGDYNTDTPFVTGLNS